MLTGSFDGLPGTDVVLVFENRASPPGGGLRPFVNDGSGGLLLQPDFSTGNGFEHCAVVADLDRDGVAEVVAFSVSLNNL